MRLYKKPTKEKIKVNLCFVSLEVWKNVRDQSMYMFEIVNTIL